MERTISFGARGGGVKTASSIGALKALVEMGFTISRISGSSMAALLAALYGVGFSPHYILKLFKQHVEAYSNASRILGGNGDFSILEKDVNQVTGNKTFKDCNIPIRIVASDGNFLRSKPVIFSQEAFPDLTLGKACQASCSYPFLYKKCKFVYEGKHYACLDGGMKLNPLMEKTSNEIAVLSTFFSKENKFENTKSLYAPAWQQAEKLADIIIKPVVPLGTLGHPEDIQKAFDIGYRETINSWKKIEEALQK